MPQSVIETKGLTKVYGDVVAVNDLDLSIDEGEVYGFLGPNGAGKTTTILMLLGLTEPTSGEARVCGFHAAREGVKVRRLAGYLPENIGFYEDLTARENLKYTAMLNDMPKDEAEKKIDEVLDLMGLKDVADDKVQTFSKGMKQRLGIGDVLVKEPRIVFLDEPTAGVDPDGVRTILDTIQGLARDKGLTVMLASHLLYQVQRICSKVGIMAKGRMVVQGPIERLGREALGGGMTIELEVDKPSKGLFKELKSVEGVEEVEQADRMYTVRCSRDVRPELSKAVFSQAAGLLQMRLRDYALEEIYIKYFREAG